MSSYPWLDQLLARWRREGRRPPSTRASHDDELVRPVKIHDATHYAQLLRVAKNGPTGAEDLLRVLNDDRKE